MNTGKAALLSTAIVAAMLGVAAGAYYLFERRLNQGVADRATVSVPEREIGPAVPPAESDASSSTCGQPDDHRLAKAVLAPAALALERSQRPVVRIELTPMAADEVGASKVGGRAYWAAGREYPRDPQGRPLNLLAQIDLAAVPKMPGYPERGLLQFFIAGDDYYGAALDAADRGDRMAALARQQGFRVVYWADASAPAVATPAGAAADGLPFDPSKPRRMRFSTDYESLGNSDVGLDEALGGGAEELAGQYLRSHPQESRSSEELGDQVADYLDRGGHKLGGHPQFTQSDPRQAGDRRVLLFQLDSDDEMMWGDSGIANFFVDPDDLARADFSRVSYHWDCY